MAEWPVMTLREARVELIDCVHETPPAAPAGFPYVAIPQMKKGRIDFSEARRISESDFIEWTRKARPQLHDVVLSRRTNPGVTATFGSECDFALGQNLVLLRADGTVVLPEFLRWLVTSPAWWEQIRKYNNVGAVFDSLRCADVPRFELPIPPRHHQKEIASLLAALDDRIELNRRMNETLEATAWAIFKDWFVDFGPTHARMEGRSPYLAPEIWSLFPDGFDDNGKPQGWLTKPLSDLTTKIGSGATPTGGSQVYVASGIALIRSQNIYDHEFMWDGLARITDADAIKLNGVAVQRGDVLINITGDSILRCCVVDPAVLPARVNQHVSIVRAKPSIPHRYIHQFLVMRQTKEVLLGFDAGGSRAAVTKAHLENLLVLVPDDHVLSSFETVTASLFARVESNGREGVALAAMRDLLLPKLMSGENRLRDAEKVAEATL
jgi:type I restriction enzyme, S subunit